MAWLTPEHLLACGSSVLTFYSLTSLGGVAFEVPASLDVADLEAFPDSFGKADPATLLASLDVGPMWKYFLTP